MPRRICSQRPKVGQQLQAIRCRDALRVELQSKMRPAGMSQRHQYRLATTCRRFEASGDIWAQCCCCCCNASSDSGTAAVMQRMMVPVCPCNRHQALRQAVWADSKGVVSHNIKTTAGSRWQSSKQAVPCVRECAQPAVHRLRGAHDTAARCCRQCLVAQAHS